MTILLFYLQLWFFYTIAISLARNKSFIYYGSNPISSIHLGLVIWIKTEALIKRTSRRILGRLDGFFSFSDAKGADTKIVIEHVLIQ